MGFLIFILFLFIFFVGGGWLIGRSIGGFIGKRIDSNSYDKPTYIDNSVHHHLHVHEHGSKTVENHNHLHQNLTVIDEETHQKGLDYFSNKKDSRNE